MSTSLSSRNPTGGDQSRPEHAARVSVGSYVRHRVDWEGLVLFMSSTLSGSHICSPSLPPCSLIPESRESTETFHLVLSIPRLLILCILFWLWLSICVLLCCRRKLWWRLSSAVLGKHSQTQLGVILLLCSWSWTVVLCFLLAHRTPKYHVPVHPSIIGSFLCSRPQNRCRLVSPASFVLLLH